FSSRRRHTRWPRDWSSDVCSSDLQHPLAAAGQRSEHREVRHVAGREDERPLAMREGRELLLEELVLGAVPGDEMGGAAPGARARGARAHGRSERRVTREPEVIIAREVDEPPPAVE